MIGINDMYNENSAQQMMDDYNDLVLEAKNEKEKIEQNPNYDKKVQDLLNKLISEEILAYDFYVACVTACCKECRKVVSDLFSKIATDEFDDHYKSLIDFADQFGYDVPFKHKDYVKYASKASSKQIDSLVRRETAAYYVKEAIKSEEDAIKSYSEALKYENLPYELTLTFNKILFDEKEHLEKLQTLLLGCENNVEMYVQ